MIFRALHLYKIASVYIYTYCKKNSFEMTCYVHTKNIWVLLFIFHLIDNAGQTRYSYVEEGRISGMHD